MLKYFHIILKKFIILSIQDKAYVIILAVWFVFLLIFRLHNSLAFNPYWGYDGGGHVDYLLSLTRFNRLPSLEQNYIAWHEPLYYLLMAGLGKAALWFHHNLSDGQLLKLFGAAQACLSVAVSLIVWRLSLLISQNKTVVLAAVILASVLPPFNQASTFLTNELLNIFFIFLLSYYFIKNFLLAEQAETKRWLLLGIIAGLALITKITAIIPVAVIIFIMFIKLVRAKQINLAKSMMIFILAIIIINLPWQIYRRRHVYSQFSINNIKTLTPQPLKLDQRLGFFTWFDQDIFVFPYWYAGGRSFWSMLYADSFYDYYATIENKDYLDYLKENQANELVRTTHLPTYATKQNYGITKILVWLGLPLALLLIAGMMNIIKSIWQERGKFNNIFSYGGGVSFGLLLALIYAAYRYPFYDQGIVKSIFIAPAYFFWIIFGLQLAADKLKKLNPLVAVLAAVYILFVTYNYWVIKFNY